jgi:hypothetical protein
MRNKWVLGCLCAFLGIAAADAFHTGAFAQSKASFEIYGFAEGDAIYDAKRVDPTWDDTLRPSKIPTVSGLFGGDGQSSVSVKQSRFGVQGNLPVENDLGPISFKFEIDMFGVGVDEGQTTIRLRHAYGEWGQVLAGQKVGVKQVDEHIWLVTFMDYDLGYFDDETCRLEPIDNPFGSKLLPMSPE